MTTTPSLRPHPPVARDAPDDAASEGMVEVRIVSMDAEAARHVADALRLLFAGDEQRSYPALTSGRGTRLHLTLDPAAGAGPLRSWLEASRPPVDRTHPGETARVRPSLPPRPAQEPS
ncbi:MULTISPECIES: hypothetical protein [unclassified Streptomyces]|uniref:hypothetical protein n=1 Tax=unclassified Streptomyces TaxID=2593676 RepID=UPI000AD6EB8B|nr:MULTISPECIES: hypothetical protein [unclassified Streptomyces]